MQDAPSTDSLSRLAFGSCRKQTKPQPIWEAVAATQPELWLWTGDAIYPSWPSTPALLRDAYAQADADHGQRAMINATRYGVEGVYDDHDFGENDGGRFYPHREAARQIFLDQVLRAPEDSPRRSQEGGLYAARTFGPPTRRVKLVMLDTRYSRDSHTVPSVGGWRVPKAGYLAAMERLACGALGIGRAHAGDVLGEAQWAWLRRELTNSTAAVHLVVSSIQVLTSNPLVESWGHFPAAKARLLRLLQEAAPPGALLLSGDVHFAELLGPSSSSAAPAHARALLEVTSSGLTHACGKGGLARLLCTPMLRLFSRHRLPLTRPHPDSFLSGALPASGGGGGAGGGAGAGAGAGRAGGGAAPPRPDLSGASSVYSGENFGTIDFEWPADGSVVDGGGGGGGGGGAVHIQLRDVHGSPVIEHRLPLGLGHALEAARWRDAQTMPSLFDVAGELRDSCVVVAAVLGVLVLALRRCRSASATLRVGRSFASKSI